MIPALFGSGARALLSHLQTEAANPYSGDNALVIVDESAVVGALVGSTVRTTRDAQLHTAALLLKWYGPGFVARIRNLTRAGRAMVDLRPDDFYLSHIAVLPGKRGHGAGRELLHAGEQKAAAAGAHAVALDVDVHNERARSFYEGQGYRPASAVTIYLGSRGTFSFSRLIKAL